MTTKRETAGALSLKARNDKTKYNSREVAYAAIDDIGKNLQECIWTHNKIFNEKEYCVGFVYASDPLIAGLKRRKFFAMLYLPSPRPEQTVFLYSKEKDTILKRLWCLPDAKTMAMLSESQIVDPSLKTMKMWSDAFFDGQFWQIIRSQHNLTILSEIEYLNANRKELIQSGCKEVDSTFSDPFDFTKVAIDHIVDTETAILQ